MTFDAFVKTKATAGFLAALSDEKRSEILRGLAAKLREKKGEIIEANQKDCARMEESSPLYDRLLLTSERIEGIAGEVENVAGLKTPLGKEVFEFNRTSAPNEMPLNIKKVTVPLGVVGVIYESRPNVTVDIFSLCFKAGNACILKGGKEAEFSNQALVEIIHEVLSVHGVPTEAVFLMPAGREHVATLLEAVGVVDICIPRGSERLINFVRDTAKVPVIETGAGVCHTYVHEMADISKAAAIVENAKTRRVSVCNALDCLVIDEARLGDLPAIMAGVAAKEVEVFADAKSFAVLDGEYSAELLKKAEEADFGREFLSMAMAVKVVAGIDEALAHIGQFGSGHSEAIVTEDCVAAERFLQQVDSAAVYHNASTAFSDGAQFGLGAEIGISTQKLHARGPMGLEALTSTKWVVVGDGNVRV